MPPVVVDASLFVMVMMFEAKNENEWRQMG
jgi:hypothetical protein